MPPNSRRDANVMRVEIPLELHRAIIRIMADEDLDFDQACRKAALLVDPRRDEYKKAVQDEADRLAKSRFMTQLNKARKTIEDAAYRGGYDAGLKQFTYRCNVCGEILYATPNNEWKWILEKGYLSTWAHAKCREKKEV